MRLDGRLLVVVVTATVVAFAGLGQGILRNGDEARFAVAARDVLRGGSWVIPSTLGEPMLIKPPLYVWLVTAAGAALGRLDELAARMPGALAMVVTAVGVYRLGMRLFGPSAALLAGLLFSTTLGPVLLAREVLPDTPMTMAVTLAMRAAVATAQDGSRRAAVGFAATLAVAFHFKLLAGVVPPVATVLLVAALRRDGGWLRALRPALGVAVFLALLAPWLVRFLLVPDFLMLVDTETLRGRAWTSWHNAYLSPARALELFVETSVPWIVLAPVAAVHLWRHRETLRHDPLLLPLVWLAVALALNMGIHTVRWRYLLPALPPAALLLARAWSADVDTAPGRRRRWLALGPLAVLLAGFALLGLLTVMRVPIRLWDTDLPTLLGRLPWILVPLGWIALGAAGLGLLARWPRAAMGVTVALVGATLVTVAPLTRAHRDRAEDPRPFVAQVRAAAGDRPILVNSDSVRLEFYLDGATMRLRDADLPAALVGRRGELIIVPADTLRALQQRGAVPGSLPILVEGRFGDDHLLLVRAGG